MTTQGFAQPQQAAATAWTSRQTAGAAALAFAVIVGVQNIGRGVLGAPPNEASGAEVAAYFAANAPLLSVGFSSVPLAMAAILIFIATVFPLIADEETGAAPWARLGLVGIGFLAPTFAAAAMFELTLLLMAGSITAQPATAELLWKLHAAAFAFAPLALAVAFLGLARASHLAGITAGWQWPLAAVAVALLFMAGVLSVPFAAGSTLMGLLYPGFIAWLVWLGTTGVRLLRA